MEDMNSAVWRKSSYSGGNGGSCVEVGDGGANVLVRDTKDAQRRVTVSVSVEAWRTFTDSLKN
jgi:hypothetical protein